MRQFILMVIVTVTPYCFGVDVATAESPTKSTAVMSIVTQSGVKISADKLVTLPPPTLSDSLDAQQRIEKLEDLAGGVGWKRFSRNSDVAPVKIKLEYVKDDNDNRIGHLIHVGFVVHVNLDTLKDKDMMKQMFSDSKDSDEAEEAEELATKEVDAEKLSALGIEPDDQSSFVIAEMPLLKRVLVRGVLHLEQQSSADEINLSWHLDPRFNSKSETLNGWAHLDRENPDQHDDLNWNSFEGCGGYLNVQRLTELPDACLVEVRMVLHEPTDWFSGSNLLRSKLPLMIQELARTFRRKLK